MKVLFVENRYKTFFWDAVAECLQKSGVQIAWIVQNGEFLPAKTWSASDCVRIPYPRLGDFDEVVPEELKELPVRDRNINYFGGSSLHYSYYFHEIEKALMEVRPDLVVGEATLFHEQIVIEVCKKHAVQYVHPSSCRLPPGRFCLYAFDSMEPAGGSGQVLSPVAASELLEQLAGRKVKIDYMQKPNRIGQFLSRWRQLKGWLSVLYARMKGEVFNTPGLVVKYKLAMAHRQAKAEWERLAAAPRSADMKYVLYPLQMQPECNIDVWGQAYRRQDELVSLMASSLPDGWGLILKPNPKSKYELLGKMLDTVRGSEKIIALSHGSSMQDALAMSGLTVSVSGTISLESVFSGRPCYSLAMPYMRDFLPLRHLDAPGSLRAVIEDGRYLAQRTRDEAAQLLAYQVASSYPGIISDPLSLPASVSVENIEKVAHAILSIMKRSDE